jgi:hypothetical protein
VRKRLRLTVVFICCGLLLVTAAFLGVYCASQYVPAFYDDALATDESDDEKASDEMLQQATALASDLKKAGHWQAVFTAQQINGWLTIDLARNHADALPPPLDQPRVAIEADRVVLACRVTWGHLSSVVTITVEPYLAEPDVLALRIRGVRAGRLPLPLRRVVDQISAVAAHAELNLRWRQANGDPVALISFAAPADGKGKRVRIETLQLADGEVYIAGTTESPTI